VDLVAKKWKFPNKSEDKSPEAWAKLRQNIPARLSKRYPNGYKNDMAQRKRTDSFKEIEAVTNKIVEALEAGAPIPTAAAYAGIKVKDLEYWLTRGHEQPRSVYAVFLKVIREAVAKCDLADLKALGKDPDWRAHEARLKLRGFGKAAEGEDSKKGSITVNIQNFMVEGHLPAPKVKVLSQEEIEDAFEQIPDQTSVTDQRANADERGEADETSYSDSLLDSKAVEETQITEGEINGELHTTQ
jgi:hypothetical protein